MNHPKQAIWEACILKGTGNALLRSQEFLRAIAQYERAIHRLAFGEPLCDQDANLM